MALPRPPVSSLSVVLPCYREEANVERVVREAVQVGRSLVQLLEVVVVDDGSDDGTPALITHLAKELPEVRAITHPHNRGYGAALASGFGAARMDWIFYTDGDGQFDLQELPRLLGWLHDHEVVVGFRAARRDGLLRSLSGGAWTLLVDGLLDLRVRDVNCAFKVFPRELFDHFAICSTGALVDAEVLMQARRRGYRIAQVPVTHRPRTAGQQTGLSPSVVARALHELVELLGREDRPPSRLRSLEA